jgi:hypothetical protein
MHQLRDSYATECATNALPSSHANYISRFCASVVPCRALPCALHVYLDPAVTDKCATSSLAARARDAARTRPPLVLQLHRQVELEVVNKLLGSGFTACPVPTTPGYQGLASRATASTATTASRRRVHKQHRYPHQVHSDNSVPCLISRL